MAATRASATNELTAGVVGMGAMGMGIALSLLRGGFRTTGFDLNPDAMARLAEAGGTPAATLAAVAEADVIFLVVVNAAQVDAVLFGADGLAPALREGAIVALDVTVPPAFARDVAARLAERGIVMLDAPISGGSARAHAGELTVMASGAPAAFDRAAPLFDAIAAKLYRLGDEPGAGSTVKMINQLLCGVHIAAMGEAMALGIRAGVDARTIYEVISNSAGSSWMFQNRGPHIVDNDYTPLSAVDIFVKDLGIVLETGKALTFPLPVAASAHQMFLAASGSGYGREDDAAVIKVYRDLTGIALPGDEQA
mgnify:FL=1